APRGARLFVQGVRSSRRHAGRRQPAVHAPYGGDLARTWKIRSDAFLRRGAAQPPPLRLGAVWRRRTYVPRPALRLHAGEMFCAAFPAKSRGIAGAGLQAGLADVADPEDAGWFARGVEGGVMLSAAWR